MSVTDRMALARVAKRLDSSAAYELVQDTWQLISRKDNEVAEAECCRIFFVGAQELFPELALRALNRLESIRNDLSNQPQLSREADLADPFREVRQQQHTHRLSRVSTQLAIATAHVDVNRAIGLAEAIQDPAGRSWALCETAKRVSHSDLNTAIELRLQASPGGDLSRDLAALVNANLTESSGIAAQTRISRAVKLIREHLEGEIRARALAFLLEDIAKFTPSLGNSLLPQILTDIPWLPMSHANNKRLIELTDRWGGTASPLGRRARRSSASSRRTIPSENQELRAIDAAIAKTHLDDHLERALGDLWMLSVKYDIPQSIAQEMLESIAAKVDQLQGSARERLIGELALKARDICTCPLWLRGFLARLLQMLQARNRLEEMYHIQAESHVIRAMSWLMSEDITAWWAFVCGTLKEQSAHGSEHLMAATVAQWAVFESVVGTDVLSELQTVYEQVDTFFDRLPTVLFDESQSTERVQTS